MATVATATELEQALMNFVRMLRRHIFVNAVILYGSYVNGTPNEWSDFDVAVISSEFEGVPMRLRQTLIALATMERDRRISPIGFPLSEYRNPGRHSFLGEIIRTGRVIYQRDDASAS